MIRPITGYPQDKARVTEIPEGGFAPPSRPPTTTFQKRRLRCRRSSTQRSAEKNFGRKTFWSKVFWPEMFRPKNFRPKFFWSKIVLVEKVFGRKKNWPKIFSAEHFFDRKNFRPKTFSVGKFFGGKKNRRPNRLRRKQRGKVRGGGGSPPPVHPSKRLIYRFEILRTSSQHYRDSITESRQQKELRQSR